MYKIVVLSSMDKTKAVFSDASLEQLSAMGEVIFNEETVKPDIDRAKVLVKDADIVITSWGCPKLDKEILDCAPNLKLVLHAAGSVKGIITPELWEKGIRVSNAAEALGRGVAETTLGLTITSLKDLWNLSKETRKGGWWNISKERLIDVYDITIGVVGAGNAGRHYMKLMQSFEVDILLYDPTVSFEEAEQMGATKVELNDLLKRSDVVSIHAPSIPATHHMLNKEGLQLMKDHAVIINTARGDVIDEKALIEELQKNRFIACLDVTDPEPPAEESVLRTLPNVILTPHIAGAVTNGKHRVGKYINEDLQNFINDKKMMGEVYFEKLNIIG